MNLSKTPGSQNNSIDLTNNHKTAFVYSGTLWANCVPCFMNETILAKTKIL